MVSKMARITKLLEPEQFAFVGNQAVKQLSPKLSPRYWGHLSKQCDNNSLYKPYPLY